LRSDSVNVRDRNPLGFPAIHKKIDLAGSGPNKSPVQDFAASQDQCIRLSGYGKKQDNAEKLDF
jgi:hypothetical protein